ncbi:hypothetical protein SMSP2_02517 [Limihaloglobus sulfuriphilus]|uniref:Polymerase nucleotidyl transferase domain-containing protein n=1 Tax=Limihaloglobus sulfuriphilus TaxID=1851148 RepID=A0A1R7T614_9BACT|nr:hypothetical protein [Limihaloglobus sulfuriphilus]AQQ72136.1 hypothetical protein SMSP2_02517 [Limihaloglobus sulfuriphilus]
MKADGRVLAGFVSGSANTSHEDEYSDVDAVFVVRDDSFEDITAALADFFAAMCDGVELVWAERFNNDMHHNYAVLLRRGDNLLQYDISIDKLTFRSERKILAEQMLFDKAGCLEITQEMPPRQLLRETLRWHIEAYWVWVYIHAKYLRRGDFIKLVYVQQELFNNHAAVLGNLYKETLAYSWWPQMLNALPDVEKRDWMMNYLCHPDINSIREKLPNQIAVFSGDARKLCELFDIEYPCGVESAVLEHLNKAEKSNLYQKG